MDILQLSTCTYEEVGTSIVGGLWESKCGHEHYFDGTPIEESWKFCPHCGKPIKEDPLPESER